MRVREGGRLIEYFLLLKIHYSNGSDFKPFTTEVRKLNNFFFVPLPELSSIYIRMKPNIEKFNSILRDRGSYVYIV